MSRAVASALIALVLGSNLVGGIAWWCHTDGEAHDEPCCGMDAQADQAPRLGDAGCCEQLSQWRLTQAVERVESGARSPALLVALAVVIEAAPRVFEAPVNRFEQRPRPGGRGLLAQHRALLI